jgi:hypothetical protein
LDIEETTLREKGENCIPQDSVFLLFTKDVQIEENEMGWTYRLHGGFTQCTKGNNEKT